MQQTKLDRWIRKTFVNKTEVLLMRKPDFRLPLSSKLKKLKEGMGGQYNFRLSFSNEEQAEKIIEKLKQARMSYAVNVKEKNNFFSSYMKGGKRSCTLGCLWLVFLILLIAFLVFLVYKFKDNEIIESIIIRIRYYLNI